MFHRPWEDKRVPHDETPIPKGSRVNRQREVRRVERLQRIASIPTTENPTPPGPQQVNKAAQNRVILELAWKTVALMQKNKLIQQKIIALQKETSEFVAAVMRNPENKRRYLEHLRLYGARPQENMTVADTVPIKIEPEV